MKKYNVLLSYPAKPGKISIVDGLSGNSSFVTHANESRLWKDEFVKNVAVPFNAYSAAKDVEVGYSLLPKKPQIQILSLNVSVFQKICFFQGYFQFLYHKKSFANIFI